MTNRSDLLLHWMSHQGRVSSQTLRIASESLWYEQDDIWRKQFFQGFRLRLTWLAHTFTADEYIHITSPCLILLPYNSDDQNTIVEAVFCGGRTPQLVTNWIDVAGGCNCSVLHEPLYRAPTRISLKGKMRDLERASSAINVPVIFNFPLRAIKSILYLDKLAQILTALPPPSGVTPEVYDMETGEWEPKEPKENDACRYKPVYGPMSYYVVRSPGLVRLDEVGQAVFIAAHLQRQTLCRYEPDTHRFIAPTVSLPKQVARALCLCTGRPANREIGNNHLVFSGVPQSVADAALKCLGQDFPIPSPSSHSVDERPFQIHWFD